MSWSEGRTGLAAPRRAALAVLLLPAFLAACGFQPLYGDHGAAGPVAPELASIEVMAISDRSGQLLTNELRDGLNPRSAKVPIAYELDVSMVEGTVNLMTRQNASAAVNDVNLTATWALKRLSDNRVVVSGRARAATGHDVLTNEYANVVSSQADLGASIREVSEEIQTRLAVYFQDPQ